jgi:hypothetical protein
MNRFAPCHPGFFQEPPAAIRTSSRRTRRFGWLLSTCSLALGEIRLFDLVRIMWFQSIPFALAPFDPLDSHRGCQPQRKVRMGTF